MVSRAERSPFADWWWTVDRWLLTGLGALMVLGIVLGDLLEKNLRRALILSDGDISPFFTRPISGVVAALIFGTIAWKVWDLRVKNVVKAPT